MIRKIGLLGGTFDPVHYGHLALAQASMELCELSEVVCIPAAVPPHKQGNVVAPFAHRFAMLNIAVAEYPALRVSSIEQSLAKPSYTIDTLNYLKSHSMGAVEYFFITGADAFLDIQSWKNFKDVLSSCNFIVFTRKGESNENLHVLFEVLGYSYECAAWRNSKNEKIICTPLDSLPMVSSSDIRQLVVAGNDFNQLLPVEVGEYITRHQLYRKH